MYWVCWHCPSNVLRKKQKQTPKQLVRNHWTWTSQSHSNSKANDCDYKWDTPSKGRPSRLCFPTQPVHCGKSTYGAINLPMDILALCLCSNSLCPLVDCPLPFSHPTFDHCQGPIQDTPPPWRSDQPNSTTTFISWIPIALTVWSP